MRSMKENGSKRPREDDHAPSQGGRPPRRDTQSKEDDQDLDVIPKEEDISLQSGVASEFDDRLLEQFLRAMLHLMAVDSTSVLTSTRVVMEVREALALKNLKAELYGSKRTGLLLPSSDFDFYVSTTVDESQGASAGRDGNAPSSSLMNRLVSQSSAFMTRRERQAAASYCLKDIVAALRRDGRFSNVIKISHANVPIVKCVHTRTRSQIDFSIVSDGIITSQFLIQRMMEPECILARSLIVLVKALLAEWGLNDPSCGGLGSFPVALMVIWFLQSEAAHYEDGLKCSLAVNLLGFLKFYGEDFDFLQNAIDVGRKVTFRKPKSYDLMLMNPIDPTRNAAKACTKFASEVRPRFGQAYRTLMEVSVTPMDSKSSRERNLLLCLFQRTVFAVDRDGSRLGRLLTDSILNAGVRAGNRKQAPPQPQQQGHKQRTHDHSWNEHHIYTGGNLFSH